MVILTWESRVELPLLLTLPSKDPRSTAPPPPSFPATITAKNDQAIEGYLNVSTCTLQAIPSPPHSPLIQDTPDSNIYFPHKTLYSPTMSNGTNGTNGAEAQSKFDPNFTDHVIGLMSPETEPRQREILTSLIRHMHDFCREVELKQEEWIIGVNYINSLGQAYKKNRNETWRVCDILGIES